MEPAAQDSTSAPELADDTAADDLQAVDDPDGRRGRWTGLLAAGGALLVVAGSLLVVARTLQPPPKLPAPPPVPRTSSIPKLEFSVPNPSDASQQGSDVDYQCIQNGKTVYSNKPCPGGQRMDSLVIKGTEPVKPQEPGVSTTPAPDLMETPVSTGPAHLQQCEELEAQIKGNDDELARAAAGTRKDELTAEQRRLQKARRDLHC